MDNLILNDDFQELSTEESMSVDGGGLIKLALTAIIAALTGSLFTISSGAAVSGSCGVTSGSGSCGSCSFDTGGGTDLP